MSEGRHINICDYDYNLPESAIARYPLDKRDDSKLLVSRSNVLSSDVFRNISDYLPANSLIVFNNTKVINARLHFTKDTGSKIEIFCLEPLNPIDYSISLSSNSSCSWKCLVGNNKKWKNGILTKNLQIRNLNFTLSVSRIATIGNAFEILFNWDNSDIIFSEILEVYGNIPVPPYLNRESESIDTIRYQTIYSTLQGSVAAPTAGLHFTTEVFNNLTKKNIKREQVTLHVGAGTFQPVKAEVIADHEMHTEHFIITKENIISLIENVGNITVVGTTSVRTLESLYQIAVQLSNNPQKSDNDFFVSQWEAYETNILNHISVTGLLNNLISWMSEKNYEYLNCSTQIMIIPGYKFKLTDRLITNFHQPKSTLLLLLAAFTGDGWKDAYQYALENNFRFLSYGDSCLFSN